MTDLITTPAAAAILSRPAKTLSPWLAVRGVHSTGTALVNGRMQRLWQHDEIEALAGDAERMKSRSRGTKGGPGETSRIVLRGSKRAKKTKKAVRPSWRESRRGRLSGIKERMGKVLKF